MAFSSSATCGPNCSLAAVVRFWAAVCRSCRAALTPSVPTLFASRWTTALAAFWKSAAAEQSCGEYVAGVVGAGFDAVGAGAGALGLAHPASRRHPSAAARSRRAGGRSRRLRSVMPMGSGMMCLQAPMDGGMNSSAEPPTVPDDEVDAGDRVPRVFTRAGSCTGYLRAAGGVRIDGGRYHGLEQAQPVETFQAPHGERMRARQLGESHPEAVQRLALAKELVDVDGVLGVPTR